MNPRLLLVLPILLFNFTSFAFIWTQKSAIPTSSRFGPYSFALNNLGYVGGGASTINQSGPITYNNDLWEYNPISDTWSQKASLPSSGRYTTASFAILNKGYIVTGFTQQSGNTNQNWEYDPIVNSWAQKSNFPGTPRSTCTSFSLGSEGYVGMGKSGSNHSDFYKYNPVTDSWIQIASIPGTLRQSAAGFAIDNYGFVLGGANEQLSFNTNEFWRYSPANNSWIQMANYPGGASYAFASFVLNNIAYAGCGSRTNSGNLAVYSDFYSYNPQSNLWTQVSSFGGGQRNSGASMTIGNKGYLGMGSAVIPTPFQFLNDWWTFEDPTSLSENTTNPFNVFAHQGEIAIQLGKEQPSSYTFTLYDSSGKMIRQENIPANTLQISYTFTELNHSVYFYSIANLSDFYSGKILLAR